MSKDIAQDIINQSIAVIGVEGRFPGAENVEQYWQNIIDKKDVRRTFTEQELQANGVRLDALNDPNYIKAGYVLDDIANFDAPFFKISAADAEIMDPQQRLMLETAYLCMESSGYNPDSKSFNAGVFIGAALSTYFLQNYDSQYSVHKSLEGMQHLLMNESIATYLAYKLNCTGPAITLNTTCSSSLVAVHYACSSLLSYECDMALAGGVSIDSNQETGYLHREGWLSSPDGYCRPFDELAKGTIPGNGLGMVLLKRLEDALSDGDYVYAIIRGSAVNNDGADKVGYTAPSFMGQSQVITEALHAANVDVTDITLLEAHGTGTPIGDPLEIAALTSAYRRFTKDNQFCAIGSVKSNIGHLNAASGIAGLIKVIKALENNILPPTMNYAQANAKINFEDTPFFVNLESRLWASNSETRYAGVSSFGVGGTNAHVILQSPPIDKKSTTDSQSELILLSAKSSSALTKKKTELANFLERHSLTADIAYTLATARYPESYRSICVIADNSDRQAVLKSPDFYVSGEKPAVIFMFAGQGAQYCNMFSDLYERYSIFREYLEEPLELLHGHYEQDLRTILFTSDELLETKINDTVYTQPILFSVQYALAKTLLALGVEPSAMIGHSIGEYVCACISGVLSLRDVIKLIIARSKLFLDIEAGAMLAAKLPPERALEKVNNRISLAAINGLENCVFSGDTHSITQLKAQLDQENIGNVLLKTSHAFHSHMIEPKLAEFESVISTVIKNIKQPQIPYLSNVTGDWVDFETISKVQYWSQQLRGTVLFAQGLDNLMQLSNPLFLEVSPKQTLANIVRSRAKDNAVIGMNSDSARQSDDAQFLEAIGRLWCHGVNISWLRLYQNSSRQRVPIRLNPFVGQRYWINKEQNSLIRTAPDNWYYRPVWTREPLHNYAFTNIPKNCWLLFCNQSSLSNEIQTQLLNSDQSIIKIIRGEKYQKNSDADYVINPESSEQYKLVLAEVFSQQSPCYIIHLWGLDTPYSAPLTYEQFLVTQKNTFYSSLYLVQALGSLNISDNLYISFLTHYAYSVLNNEKVNYAQTSISGSIKVIAQEYPNLHCCHMDIGTDEDPEKVALKIIAENLRELPKDIIAFRNNYSWLPDFQKVEVRPEQKLRTKGTYLIIGGLGQIGLTLAAYLYEKYQANLILTQRSDLPADENWTEIISQPTHPWCERLKVVKELRERGANILTFSLDVSDFDQLEQIYLAGKKQFSNINGIIHAAGTIDASAFFYINETTDEYCNEQFKTKVAGMLNVHKLVRDETIDFVCLFSSISSLLGGLRHFAYAAANACLDAFVEERAQWSTINWDGWLFKNISERMKIDPSKLPSLYLTPEEGAECFENAIGLISGSQILISSGDFHQRIASWSHNQPDKLALPKKMYQRPQMTTEFVEPTSKTQHELCAIWQKLLGLSSVGVEDNFFELGGDSLLATQFALQIRKSYTLEIPMRLFFDQPTIRALSEFIDNDLQEQKLNSKLTEFLHDLELTEQILTRNVNPVGSAKNNVLLTGATGFLGVHLLAELCIQTNAYIYCLIKAVDYSSAKQKLINQLNHYGIEEASILPKVKIILGDLEKASLGLNQNDYDLLASDIDRIYHNGAKVHHLYDYSQLRAANVMSTLEIIKLASEHHQKPIHYISTLIAATERDSEDQILEDFPHKVVPELLGGYQQSKWMAEKLLASAHQKGIPVTIYRPNLIIGQIDSGITSSNGNHFLSLIKGCIQMKCAPDWMRILDMMPVDYLAKIIIKFSLLQDVSGKVFNLINPHSPAWLNLIEWLKEDGYELDVIAAEKWVDDHLVKVDQSNALYHLVAFYLGSTSAKGGNKLSEPVVRTDLTQSYLDRVNLAYPIINKTIFKPHFDYLRSVNFI